jgi:hypothetical protein
VGGSHQSVAFEVRFSGAEITAELNRTHKNDSSPIPSSPFEGVALKMPASLHAEIAAQLSMDTSQVVGQLTGEHTHHTHLWRSDQPFPVHWLEDVRCVTPKSG